MRGFATNGRVAAAVVVGRRAPSWTINVMPTCRPALEPPSTYTESEAMPLILNPSRGTGGWGWAAAGPSPVTRFGSKVVLGASAAMLWVSGGLDDPASSM